MKARDSMLQILYVGADQDVSKAGCICLRRAGFKVRMAKPGNVTSLLRKNSFGVAVLCATLSTEESENVVRLIRAFAPNLLVIGIYLGHLGDGPNLACQVVVDLLNGPEPLLEAVHSISDESCGEAIRRPAV